MTAGLVWSAYHAASDRLRRWEDRRTPTDCLTHQRYLRTRDLRIKLEVRLWRVIRDYDDAHRRGWA